MQIRILMLALLFVIAAVSAAFAFVADDVTWKAIWIGLTSTTAAAGLVDCSALWETHQREQVLLRVVGQRVGRIHQRMLWIIRAVFGVSADAREISAQLRAWEPRPIDLTQDAGILPPRSKQLWVAHCIDEIDEAMDVVRTLGAQTTGAAHMELLDDLLRSREFMVFARSGIPQVREGGELLATQAAIVLDRIQVEFRYFFMQAGAGWGSGQLDPPSG